jgi:hypothetical protein
MKIREHIFLPGGKCMICGATRIELLASQLGKTDAPEDQRSCLLREDWGGKQRPEPARRTYAHEDFDAIQAAMIAIREAAKPRCAQSGQTVHDCLRTSARCPETCPNHEFWVGPQIAPEEAGAFC